MMSDLVTTWSSVGDYVGAATHVTELDVTSGSAAAASRPAAEVMASTLVMSACIAATIVGNVLVVLSVFTYAGPPHLSVYDSYDSSPLRLRSSPVRR